MKGYGAEDEVPAYRTAAAPLLLDAVAGNGQIKGQVVPANLIRDFARDDVNEDITFRQPIGEIVDMLGRARADPEGAIRIAPPGMSQLVTLINHELAIGASGRPQQVERIYWGVSGTTLARVLDVVRTNLVELVAEMRAGTPTGESLPSREVAEQAVDVVIGGRRNRSS